jgi:multisubunit Na+/H+ antiporter MnhG subunit
MKVGIPNKEGRLIFGSFVNFASNQKCSTTGEGSICLATIIFFVGYPQFRFFILVALGFFIAGTRAGN